MTEVLYTIPSTRRPGNVPRMMEYTEDWLWVVRDERDEEDYTAAGAGKVVVQVGEGLPAARNTALAYADDIGAFCLQVDDDLRGLYRATGNRTADREPMDIDAAVNEIVYYMGEVGTWMGGACSTSNPFFSRPRIHTWAFICAQFVIVDPSAEQFWHPKIDFKDDWELTCRALTTAGAVARVDWILPDASHTGAGGLNQHRDIHKDIAGAKAVRRAYPSIVTFHKKRVGELQMIHNVTNMPRHAKEIYNKVNM